MAKRSPGKNGRKTQDAADDTWRQLPVSERITHALVKGIDDYAETDTELLRQEAVGSGGGQRRRSAVPHVPHRHAGVATGDKEREVQFLAPAPGGRGDLRGHDRPDDEA